MYQPEEYGNYHLRGLDITMLRNKSRELVDNITGLVCIDLDFTTEVNGFDQC